MQFTNASPVKDNLILYARWELRPYQVTFYDALNQEIKVQQVLYGGDAIPPANPIKLGYTFVNWDESYVNITNDIIIKPIFIPNTNTIYTTHYYRQSVDGLTYELFESIENQGESDTTVNAIIRTYNGFYHEVDNPNNQLSNVISVDGKMELNVYYLRTLYTVTFKNEDESVISSSLVRYQDNVTSPPQPTKIGYTFSQWNQPLENITNDTNIYPVFTPNQYNIIFDVNTGNSLDDPSVDVTYLQEVGELPIPTKDGYTFIKWEDQHNQIYTQATIYELTTNLTLYAVWIPNDASYLINHYLENEDGTFSLFETDTIQSVTDLEVNALIKDYTGYTQSETHENNLLNGIVKADNSLTLSVYYNRIFYTVNFVDYDDQIIKSEQVKYLLNASAPTNPNRIGYTFDHWDLSYSNITSNMTIKALYTINQYTLNFNVDGGVAIDSALYDYNTLIELPIPTKLHYDFIGWQLNATYITMINVTEDLTITAIWEPTIYQISFNTSGGDQIADLEVIYGQELDSLSIPTKLDYTFDGWFLDSTEIVLPYTFTSSTNIELVASWIGLSAGISYEITADTVKILSYTGNETTVVIPDTIAGYPVTTIGANVFANNSTITSLSLGTHVTTIENQAFYQMTNLEVLKTFSKDKSTRY